LININILSNLKFNKRTESQIKNIAYSALYKLVGVLISLLLVPICLRYLDSNNYGVWLTISSTMSWISLLDLGIGNGLKNKLTENLAKENIVQSKSLVSTSYFIFFVIILVIVILFLILNHFTKWENIFKLKLNDGIRINTIMPILFIFFSIRFVLDLINSILFAHQRADLVARNNLYINALVFIGIFILTKSVFINKLLWLNIVSNGIPIFFLLLISIYYFKGIFKKISPNIKNIKLAHAKELLSVGLKFFTIQVASLIIFSTDNIIITSLFTPKDVTLYNIPYKLFSLFIFGWTIILTPLWTAFGEAFIRKDFVWIKKVVSVLNKAWVILLIVVILTIILSSRIYNFWLGDTVLVPIRLSIFMGIFVLISTYTNIYVYFINGVGKLNIQFYTSIFAALVNIPLCLFMTKNLGFGVDGIIIATCLSISLNPILAYYQYYKIINNKASGIWFS
jgi:O-antigen/teichoic acid export membrane protein